MSLRFIDGCSHYGTSDITKKWTAAGSGGTIAVVPGTGRFGGNGLRIDPLSISAFVSKTLDAQTTWIIGFSLNPPGLPATTAVLLQLVDGSNGVQVDLRVNPDGTLSVTRNGAAVVGGTSTIPIRVSTSNFIEFKVTIASSISANTCQVCINGGTVLTVATGQNLQNTTNATANTIVVAGPYIGSIFCDFYICDGAGSANNTILGDCRVATLFPNGPGASTQFSVTGAATNWQAVSDAAPDNDSTYVSSNTPNQIDLYTLQNLTLTGTIKGVQTVLDARKDDAGTRTLAAVVQLASTNYVGATVSLALGYQLQLEIRETNPNTGVAWLVSDINAPMQLGEKLIA